MAQVSRRRLHPAVKAKIHDLLLDCIKRCQDQETAANFVEDLLTDTEKIMIAKRVAIALMVLKGYKDSEIEDRLKVSRPTVWMVKTWLHVKGRGYRKILEKVIERDSQQMKEHGQAKWVAEETTPRWGTNWKAAKRGQWERVRETEVPF